MPDDHSELVPLLPIPNRTVKRLSADDSADARVKVGHRQALTAQRARLKRGGPFVLVFLLFKPNQAAVALGSESQTLTTQCS